MARGRSSDIRRELRKGIPKSVVNEPLRTPSPGWTWTFTIVPETFAEMVAWSLDRSSPSRA